MSLSDPVAGRAWTLPPPLRRTIQLSCYGDLTPLFRQANLLVLKACLQAPTLWSEATVLERLLYRNQHQHRGAHLMRYLKEVRRTLSELRSLQLGCLLDDLSFLLQKGGALAGASRGGVGGGRVSYRLPSRGAAEALMKQLITATALIRGLQPPLHRAAGHLAAQLAMTFFVPMATVATAMLARIKVLSLQLMVDCVKTYNAVADLLPVLPNGHTSSAATAAATMAGQEGTGRDSDNADSVLLLPPELVAALQPPPQPPQSAAAPKGQPLTQQQQQQQQAAIEPRSRSLRLLLQRQPAAPTTAEGALGGGSAPTPEPGASNRGGASGRSGGGCGAGVGQKLKSSVVLPHMVRCRWDEHIQVPYLEEVPPGPDDPTWQQRAAKVAEQYGYMIAVQLEDLDSGTVAAEAGAAAMPRSGANPRGPGPQQQQSGAVRTGKRTREATGTAPLPPLPTTAASGEVGVRVDRRSFFDLMAAQRPAAQGLGAPAAAVAQLGAGGKRSHAGQAMAPLQVFEDRGISKRQKTATSSAPGAPLPNASAAAAAGGGAPPAMPAAAIAAPLSPAATVAVAGAPSRVPPASPVVLSYATRHAFVLGRSGATTGGAVPATAVVATGALPPAAAFPFAEANDSVSGGGSTLGQDGATLEGLRAVTENDGDDDDDVAAAAPANKTFMASTRPGNRAQDAARAHVEEQGAGYGSTGADTTGGTAGDTVAVGVGRGAAALVGAPRDRVASRVPSVALRTDVLQPIRPGQPSTRSKPAFLSVPAAAAPFQAVDSLGGDGGAAQLSAAAADAGGGSSATAASAATAAADDPMLGIILGGSSRGKGLGKSRGGAAAAAGGGAASTRPGLMSGSTTMASSADAGGGNSLAASLELLLGGVGPAGGGGAGMGGGGRGGAGRGAAPVGQRGGQRGGKAWR